MRSIDSNYPEFVLALADLVKSAADRRRREGLVVEPSPDTEVLEVVGGKLRIPSFTYLAGELFHEAATRGIESPAVVSYLDSVLEFAADSPGEPVKDWKPFKTGGRYQTTESDILSRFGPSNGVVSEEGRARPGTGSLRAP